MANLLEVRQQLHSAGFKNKYWGWSAIRQLPMILEADEEIERVVTGIYSDGHAVVLATNKRMIILDKKPMSFRAEDIHYEMVSEVEHYLGPLAAKLRIHCLSKSFEFSSLRHQIVQSFAIHVDQKVNQIRLNMRNVTTWSEMLDQTKVEVPQPATHPLFSASKRMGFRKPADELKSTNIGSVIHKQQP